jgi:hypothetical protein
MNTGLLLAKIRDPKERSVARIIPIEFNPAKKVRERETILIQKETILFYTRPIFRAKKYELF